VVMDLLPRLDAALVRRVVVVGKGPLSASAAALNDPRLVLRGTLSPEGAHQVIAEADVLLALSRILENQQTILLEAMVEGTPVIATDTGGTRETLENTGCPIVTTGKGMAEAVQMELTRMLSDRDFWSKTSQLMAERAKRHDPEAYISALERLFTS
jgi:glycosyltransferase involved in cell wall biosynthesis